MLQTSFVTTSSEISLFRVANRDRVLSRCDKNSSTWNLQAAENGQKGKQIFEVGWWNPLTGLRMTDDLLPHVTGGFRGRRIAVTSMHFPPWQMITRDDPENPDNVTYSGLMFEVLNHMSKDLNFTYEVLEPRHGETWGHLQSDGSWSGMMKLVAENKVVLAAAAFTVTPERSNYVDFTQVIERESYGFMVNRPNELSRVLLFAAPFSYPVWICIIITVILVAPVLNAVHRSSYFYTFYHKVDENNGLSKMKNCYWYIYGSLLQQGATKWSINHVSALGTYISNSPDEGKKQGVPNFFKKYTLQILTLFEGGDLEFKKPSEKLELVETGSKKINAIPLINSLTTNLSSRILK
ncbi:Glutamate receptor ionotropic, delta-1 [Folsomia candida]|uniref:Glutamate receptor ionotropic, delta-1 n=1 Tax=Folsomia candida TaxID=158441 RepID=A0A226DNM1_FOLCA|nr:Glutamate receptor ionotropic, delta-1 [Folsomia candida]